MKLNSAASAPVFLALFGLASGCGLLESRSVKNCKAELEANLKSPSSLKIVSVEEYKEQSTVEASAKLIGLGVFQRLDKKWLDHEVNNVTVIIEYDAANSYGAMLRDTKICKGVEADGALASAITDAEIDDAIEGAEAAAKSAEEALKAAAEAIEMERGSLD